MSYFTDPTNNLTIYDAAKSGGTTLRSWIYYAGTGEFKLSGDSEYYMAAPGQHQQLQEWGYTLDWFVPREGDRICVKRDPVAKFVSCYEDKIVKEGNLPGMDIDTFIDNFYEIIEKRDHPHGNNRKIGFLDYHFAPYTKVFGPDTSYYTRVFDIKEISTEVKSFLEGVWGIELPDIHCRNNKKNKKLQLTEEQTKKVREIYAVDYENGWC